MTYLESKGSLLSPEHLGERTQVANRAALYLTRHIGPVGWISDIRLFGSLARAESKTDSDVDLAILTNEDISSPKMYGYALGSMVVHIEMFSKREKVPYVINPCLIMTEWLDKNPHTTALVRKETLVAIKNGIKFPFVKE